MTNDNYCFFFTASRGTQRRRATVLRNEQEIAGALDISIETEDLLSRVGSIDELARWVGDELQLGNTEPINGVQQ
jgi:hypothetical protein